MLEKIRLALRRTGDGVDSEIQDCINACYRDMARVGISIYDENGKIKEEMLRDALILSAVKTYARWQFNFEGQAERYERAYISIRDGISLCGDYIEK